MIIKKLFTFFVLFILFSIVLFPNLSASESTEIQEENSNDTLFDKLAIKIFNIPYFLNENRILSGYQINKFFPWFIYRLQEPPFFSAEPATVDIKYLSESLITIGVPDKENGGWTKDFEKWPIADNDYFKFTLDIPDYFPENAIDYRFYPNNILYPSKGNETKIDLEIITKFPDNFEIPDQFIITVNITRVQIINNLITNAYNMMREKGQGAFSSIFSAVFGYGPFASQVTGVNTQQIYLDLVVLEKRFHLIEMIPPNEIIEFKPNEVKSVPFKIKNLGSHRDIFNFDVTTSEELGLTISPPDAVTLEPNEEKTIYVGVAAPRDVLDPGTLHSLKIQVTSLYDKNYTYNNTVGIVTRGYYFSEGAGYNSIGFLVLIGIIIGIFLFYRRQKTEKIAGKPDKPWKIPEEKQNLERLAKTDKKKYNEELKRLEEEYKSSLLWYDNYVKSVQTKKKQIKKKGKTKIQLLKPKKIKPKKVKEEIKPKKEEKPKKIKQEPKEEIVEKTEDTIKEEPKIDRELETKKQQRQKIISKIRRQQEKQKKKLDKTIS